MDSQTLLNFLQTSADALKDRPTEPPELAALNAAFASESRALTNERDAALASLETLRVQVLGVINPLITTLKSSGYEGEPIVPFVEPQEGTALERLKALQVWMQSTRDSLYVAMDDHKAQQQTAIIEQQREAEQTEREAGEAQEEQSQIEQPQRLKGRGKTIRRAVSGLLGLLLISVVGFGIYVFANRPYFNPPPVGTLLVRNSDSEYSHQFVRADGLQSEMLLDYTIHPAWSVEGDFLYCGNIRQVNGLVIPTECPIPITFETAGNPQYKLVPSVDPAYTALITERSNYSYQGSRTDDTVTVYYNREVLGSFDFDDTVYSISWAYPLSLLVAHSGDVGPTRYTLISMRTHERAELPSFVPTPQRFYSLLTLSPSGHYVAYISDDGRLVVGNFSGQLILNANAIDGTTGIMALAWSPDQEYIAYATRDGVYVLEIDSGTITRLSNVGVELLNQLHINRFSFFGRNVNLNLYRGYPMFVAWGADGETDTYQSVIPPLNPTEIAVAFAPPGSFDAEATTEVTEEFNTPMLTPTHTATATVAPTNTPFPPTVTPTLTPTHTPTATRTIAPTATELITCTVSTDTVINARREPNTSADPLPNGLQPGRYTAVAAQFGTDNRYWYQLENGYWVREDVVRPVGDEGCFALISRLLTPEAVVSASTVQANPFEATGADSTVSSNAGLLAFSTFRDNNSEVYAIDLEDNSLYRLTNNEAYDADPTWSPDGRQIAFVSNRTGTYDIFVASANGTNVRQLTINQNGRDPSFSADGSQIVYVRDVDDDRNIYVIDIDGNNNRRLTDNSARNGSPAWSPDGSEIAFTSQNRGSNSRIYLMNADGTNVRQLTTSSDSASNPSWSPDGLQVAFQLNVQGGPEIFSINVDGTNSRRLTNSDGPSNYDPAWSPDGSQIAYSSNLDPSGLFLINFDGTTVRRITDGSTRDASQPAWSPAPQTSIELIASASPSADPTRTATRIIPTSTPFPTTVPLTSTPLPPSLSVSQLPTTTITNGNASQLSLIGTVPLPIMVEITGVSADRSVVALAGSGRLYVYDLINLRLIELPDSGYQRGVTDTEIAISPDGRYFAYPGDFRNDEIAVYGVTEGRVVATLRGHTDTINSLAFSPTGLTLATAASDETIRLWEVGTWRLTQTLQHNDPLQLRVDNVFSLAFSPDGRAVLASTYGNIDFWNVSTGSIAGSIGSSQRQVLSNSSTQPIMIVPNAAAVVGMTGGSVIDVWNLQTLDVTTSFSVSAQSFDVNVGANLLVTDTSGGFNVYSFFTTERIFTGNSGYSFPSRMYFARNDTLLVVVKSNEIQLWGIP